ncbi:dTDP-glucose 4,6-dehydratase [Prochlorococcus marinus]|uniref:dTDP-glucose 4,6-dehydratase n=1 Tax=Prochlorococcus marinus str. PAC1 TaxID=59924 RepID=A0A0A2C697_PROMR|nr:dTDP-glucose 4,6-dehydratase [Prochlorococcus marinus]KGG21891.1 dTDP-glucose 4,6-dehydratase [Prochlorococcus marinus str. PAC1]
MKILITGGAGFIGGALIRNLLLNTNHKLFNLDKLSYASDLESIQQIKDSQNKKRYEFFNIDLYDFEKTKEVIDYAKPDKIIHLAAESHVDRSIKSPRVFINSNIIGTFNLLESARLYWDKLQKNQDQFIFHHISTDEVFGSLDLTGRFNETSRYDPRSPYSASKASSDHLVRSYFHTYGLPTLITNCSNNFGPWQYPEKLIPVVILKAVKNESIPLYGDGTNIRDWLYVDDHIDALIKLWDCGKAGETYCIGGESEKTNLSIVKFICERLDEKLNRSESHKKLIQYVKDRKGHDQRYAIDPNKMKSKIKWSAKYDFEKGINSTIDWYLNNLSWCDKCLSK